MRGRRAFGAFLLAPFVAAAGCSALVSSELESVACKQEGAIGPPACPVGQSCRGGKCSACAPKDLCGDGVDNDCNNLVDDGCDDGGLGGAAGSGGVGGSGGDAGTGASGGTAGSPSGGSGGVGGASGSGGGGTGGTGPVVGSPCADSSSCPSGTFCGDPTWFGATGVKVCTVGCCTSDKCGEGNVCFPAVDGGSVCLPAASAGRGSLGAKLVGEQCGADAECRSGLCDGRCVDTCCADADCAGSDYCTKRQLKGTSRPAMLCGGPPGSGAFQAYCDSDSNCLSGVCGGTSSCSKPCCTKKDCSGLLDWECVYSGGVKSCGTLGVSGSAELGQSCSGGWQCKSAQCVNLGAGGFCTDSCCGDKDCVGGAGMVCRPVARTSGATELLCIK